MADAKKPRKKMTRRGFIASGATAAGLVGVTVAANVGTNMFKSAIDHYIGGGETTITNAPGSEDWDTAYYDQQYRGRGRATEEAKNIVIEIEGEGIVLLKNDNNALPLASGESVSLIGRYAADPVYGGAGSGTVDPNDCVTLYDGIVNAGLAVNDTAYNWIAETWPEAKISCEVPMTYHDENGTLYQGFIDMLLELPDGYVIIDHKTHPMAFDAESYAATCAGQLRLYRKAVETATGKPVKRTIIHLPNLGMCFEVK